jgi:hypothetical protein
MLQAANKIRIEATCADPGMSATGLAILFPGGDNERDLTCMVERMQTPQDGAIGITKECLVRRMNAEIGKHYGPEGTKGPAVINPSKPYEADPSSIDMLWGTSEKNATGVTMVS